MCLVQLFLLPVIHLNKPWIINIKRNKVLDILISSPYRNTWLWTIFVSHIIPSRFSHIWCRSRPFNFDPRFTVSVGWWLWSAVSLFTPHFSHSSKFKARWSRNKVNVRLHYKGWDDFFFSKSFAWLMEGEVRLSPQYWSKKNLIDKLVDTSYFLHIQLHHAITILPWMMRMTAYDFTNDTPLLSVSLQVYCKTLIFRSNVI